MVVRGRGRVAMAGGRERWGKGTKDVREVREKGTGTVRLDWLPRTWGEMFESLFCPRKTPMPSPAPKQTIYQTQRPGF